MPAPPLIDSHAHLTSERLREDLPGVLRRSSEAAVVATITVGTDPEDSRAAVLLAERSPGVFATVGLHPHDAARGEVQALFELAEHPRVVGIGETGLDYHYDHSPRPVQRRVFLQHLEWGRASGLPVVVHCRDADEDVAAILREAGGGTQGVLHSFAGNRALLDAALERGWYISFSGMVTFRNYPDAALVQAVPAERILVETDSPYLAPVPFRGRTNEPAHVRQVAERCAELRGEDPAHFAAAALANTRELFRLEAASDAP